MELASLRAAGHGGRRAAGCRLRPAEVLLQRQRGHLRHHAELDRPLPHQHAPDQRQGGGQPLHRGAGGYQPQRAAALPWSGRSVQRQQVCGHRHPPLRDHRYSGVGGAGKDPLRLRAAGHRQQQECRQVLRHGGETQHHPDADDLRCAGGAGRGHVLPHRL